MSHLISQKLMLICQGPVHIGSGESLDFSQYIFDQANNRAYFLNEPAWIRFLAQKRLLQSFIDFVKSPSQAKSLYDWCQKNGLQARNFAAVSTGWANVSIHGRDIRSLNKIPLLCRGADGRPFIPGSSIKGAIRTAILHHRISKLGAEQKQRYWRDFVQAVASKNRQTITNSAARIVAGLEQDLLHNLDRRNERGLAVDTQNAVTSTMQGLRVSDAYPLTAVQTELMRKLDWQTINAQTNSEKYLPLTRECFTPGTKLQFTLTIEPDILQHLGISSISDLLTICHSFTQFVLALEKGAFGAQLKNLFSSYQDSNIILGGGSGLLSKTLLYSLAPAPEARTTTAALLDIQFSRYDQRANRPIPTHRHAALDKNLSPRTLKIAKYQAKTYHMGTCRMEAALC